MLRSIWSKTLWQYRVPVLSWGLGLAFFLMVTFAGYSTQVQDAASRLSLVQLATTLRFFGDPVALDTAAGYTTWRLLDMALPSLLGIWALLAGARLVRAEEERGSIELLLATPVSRLRLLLEKVLALALALAITGILIGLGAIAGAAAAKVGIDAGRALLAGLNASLFAFCIAGLALLFSQFTRTAGGAAGLAGALLALSVLLDGTGRTIENGAWLQRLSPLHYYNANKPLIEQYSGDGWAPYLLAALILICLGISAILFNRRDIGMSALPAVPWSSRSSSMESRTSTVQSLARAEQEPGNRAVWLQALRAQAIPAFWWLFGLAFYAFWATSLVPSVLQPLRLLVAGNPQLGRLLAEQQMATNAGILALIVFAFVSLLAVIFAFNQALRWSNDLERGYLELVLSTPRSRTAILLGRFLAVVLVALLAPLLTWLAVMIAARMANLEIDATNVAAASFGFLPLELVVAAFVFALSERVRSGTIAGIVTAYLALAFLIELIRSVLNLPDWAMYLSIFHAYGNPILEGWRWAPFLAMLLAATLFLLAGIAQFRQVDIERGS